MTEDISDPEEATFDLGFSVDDKSPELPKSCVVEHATKDLNTHISQCPF